jgi:hypothetical protein
VPEQGLDANEPAEDTDDAEYGPPLFSRPSPKLGQDANTVAWPDVVGGSNTSTGMKRKVLRGIGLRALPILQNTKMNCQSLRKSVITRIDT